MKQLKLVLAVLLLFAACPPYACAAGSVQAVTNKEYLENCLSLISKTVKSIDIATLAFDNDTTTSQIKDALYQAVNRGVKVRIILDNSAQQKARDVIDELQQAGIPLKLDGPARTLHEKVIISDNQAVLFGSTNLGATSINLNNETNLLVQDAATGKAFHEYFEALWYDTNRQVRFPAAVSSGIIVPLNSFDYSRRLPGLIREARKRVWVIMYDARVYKAGTHNPTAEIYSALSSAQVRGLDVRVILEKSGFNDELNTTNAQTAQLLSNEKVPVRWDNESVITHAKLVISDDKVITGSSNWNARSLRVNNEVNALVAIPVLTNYFASYFEKLWQESSD
jgi:cardiolipin synthase